MPQIKLIKIEPLPATPQDTRPACAAPLEAALLAVNGRASTHTITSYVELARLAEEAERRLSHQLELPKAERPGARYSYASGTYLPNAYKGWAIGTAVTLLRRGTHWYLEAVDRHNFSSGYSPRGYLTLTPQQDAKAVEVLRRQYAVQHPPADVAPTAALAAKALERDVRSILADVVATSPSEA